MTDVQRRVLYPDGGFMLWGHVWKVDRGRTLDASDKKSVFVQLEPNRAEARVYRDRDCTDLVGHATRGAAL